MAHAIIGTLFCLLTLGCSIRPGLMPEPEVLKPETPVEAIPEPEVYVFVVGSIEAFDPTNAAHMQALANIITQRSLDGWELVTMTHIVVGERSFLLVTFRMLKSEWEDRNPPEEPSEPEEEQPEVPGEDY